MISTFILKDMKHFPERFLNIFAKFKDERVENAYCVLVLK